jgi:hypothetical protein
MTALPIGGIFIFPSQKPTPNQLLGSARTSGDRVYTQGSRISITYTSRVIVTPGYSSLLFPAHIDAPATVTV